MRSMKVRACRSTLVSARGRRYAPLAVAGRGEAVRREMVVSAAGTRVVPDGAGVKIEEVSVTLLTLGKQV